MFTAKARVLCVEADPDTCVLLSILLGRADYEVECVSTVADALRCARTRRFDLYLLDGWYTDGTGVELCERIRQFDTQTPVMFFSGLARDCDRQQSAAAGARAYLIKPNDIDVLAGTVGRLINEQVYAYV